MKKYILVVIVSIVVLVGLYIAGRVGLSSVRANAAENASEKFIKKLYSEYEIVGMSCQGEDTDGDNYISCDARLRNPQAVERVVHLQCPSVIKGWFGSSCKEARAVIS